VFVDASLNAAISQAQLEIEAAEESGDIRVIRMDIEALEAPPDLSGGTMTTATDHARPRSAEDSRRSVEDVQRRARIRKLENELERYRQASTDALQQLDWCIGYMCGSGRVAIARSLSKNRAYIRTDLLKRAEQPLPTEQPGPTKKLKRASLIAASLTHKKVSTEGFWARVRARSFFPSGCLLHPHAYWGPWSASLVAGRLSASMVSLMFVFQFP
jgi:hypothetical protein